MVDWETQRRMPVVCAHCGEVRVGLELQNGDIKPIGSADGCSTCDESEFEPLSRTTVPASTECSHGN